MIGIATISVFTSVAYGMAYSDSQNAINGLSVFCETTIRVYHPPSSDHPFSHFIVTFGIKNPSSTDVSARWLVSASDLSQNYYNVDGDASFTIAAKGFLTSPSLDIHRDREHHGSTTGLRHYRRLQAFTFQLRRKPRDQQRDGIMHVRNRICPKISAC